MTALRGLAAAFSGAAEGMGAGLVAEAKSAREEMMERLRQAHQSEEAEKGRQLTRDEGVLNRQQQKAIAELQIGAQKALKQMEIDSDPTKSLINLENGQTAQVVKGKDGVTTITVVKDEKGDPVRRNLGNKIFYTLGSDGVAYADGDKLPEGVTAVSRIDSATLGTQIRVKGAQAVADTKAASAIQIQDKKSGTVLDKAQIDAAYKYWSTGKKSEDAALMRDALNGNAAAKLKLEERKIDVQKEIQAAHDAAGQKRTETTAAATVTAAGVSAGPRGAKVDAESEANIRAQVGSAVRKESRERDGFRGKGFGDMTKAEWENAEIEKRVKARISGEDPAAEAPPAADPPKPRRSLMPGGAEAPPAAGLSDGPPTEAPASSAPKPAASGDVPRPDKMTDAQIIAAGKASLAQAAGRPDAAAVRAKIEARMRAWGVDPSALGK